MMRSFKTAKTEDEVLNELLNDQRRSGEGVVTARSEVTKGWTRLNAGGVKVAAEGVEVVVSPILAGFWQVSVVEAPEEKVPGGVLPLTYIRERLGRAVVEAQDLAADLRRDHGAAESRGAPGAVDAGDGERRAPVPAV